MFVDWIEFLQSDFVGWSRGFGYVLIDLGIDCFGLSFGLDRFDFDRSFGSLGRVVGWVRWELEEEWGWRVRWEPKEEWGHWELGEGWEG